MQRYQPTGFRCLLWSSVAIAALAGHPVSVAAQPQQAVTSEASSSEANPAAAQVSEVIVTAEKRAENIRQVPESVSAFPQSSLQQLNAQGLQDYINTAPGVQFDQSTPGQSNIIMRGVGTATSGLAQNQGTTAILLDDIPLTDAGYTVSLPDIDVFDLQRVEVLKGPQGAIFGTEALGGAVNYITTPVSLTSYTAHVQTGVSGTAHADDPGYDAKGAVNIPIVKDTFGIRITAIDRYDPGYINNVGTGVKDSNTYKQDDFRIDALWQINNHMSLDLLSFYDYTDSADLPYADPLLNMGSYTKSTIIPESFKYMTYLNRLRFEDDFQFATLTMTVSNTKKRLVGQSDASYAFGEPAVDKLLPHTNNDDYEVRLTSPSRGKFEWLLGLYHGDHAEPYNEPFFVNGAPSTDYVLHYNTTETSGFGQATYHLTDTLKLSAGGRYYNISLSTVSEALSGTTVLSDINGKAVNQGFSPNGSITFEPNDHILTYGLISTGFREGGINLLPPLAGFSTPTSYNPDSLVNYELGIRTTWLNRTLTFDVTPFYIDWSGIQIRLSRPDFYTYGANAASATNIGVENAFEWKPLGGLDLVANVTYLDAELSATTNLGNGTVLPKGSPIPGASHWSTYESATYNWGGDYKPYITVAHQFVSRTLDGFLGDPANPLDAAPAGNYNLFNIFAGVRLRDVEISLFAKNVGDAKGVSSAQFNSSTILQDFYVRPRTIGVSLDWRL